MLYFLYQLSNSNVLPEQLLNTNSTQAPVADMRSSFRSATTANENINANTPIHSPQKRTESRQFVVDSPAFNEAFSKPGLLNLPKPQDTKGSRALPTDKPPRTQRNREKVIIEQARGGDTTPTPEAQPVGPIKHGGPVEPSEPSLLRDLPFVLQGLSSRNLVFESSQILKLPTTLPVPILSLLHTLAEPSLLYKGLAEFVESNDGGLVGQSFRSALSKELRAYLGVVATLEGEIRRALAMLNGTQLQHELGKVGVTLKRCVFWTREATMGLRLMKLMVEESKGNSNASLTANDNDSNTGKKGGELITLIHSFSLSHGDPFVGAFAERLLSHVTRPFYDMLRQWIYDGELADPYLEFFVSEHQDSGENDSVNGGDKKGGATSVWEDKYKLDNRMIPTIITEEFANKVFLIGKTLNFIRYGCGDASWVESYSKDASKELQYGDTAKLERSIGEAYKTTMARLTHLMADKFMLFEHLNALKKYLLLGSGDFIAILMESLSSNLDRPANSQYRHTLTAQLEHAVRNSNAQFDDPEVLRRLDSRMLELSHGEIGWDVFTLEYKIDAPVDVIVTPYGSKQYLKVFNFLWRIKRVEFALSSTWRKLQTGSRGILAAVSDKLGSDWKLARCAIAEMVHFVNQLQYYILFEVIESSWSDLQKALRKPEATLDDMITAHARYLNSITRKGLLGSAGIRQHTDFTTQLHELLKGMLSYKDTVDGLYSFSVAEFTRRQELSAKIETRTAQGKWGIMERDDDPSSGTNTPSLFSSKDWLGIKKRADVDSPFSLGLANVNMAAEDDVLDGLRKRLSTLSRDFSERVNVLLRDLQHQPDSDMRWLAIAMDFNDVYKNARRERTRKEKDAIVATAKKGDREREKEVRTPVEVGKDKEKG
jgi:gamma-tubulin complex component 3